MPITTLKLTSKGQITFRKELLRHFGLQPGDSVIFEYADAGEGTFRPAPRRDFARLFGSLTPPAGTKLTLDEIKQTIEKGWAGER